MSERESLTASRSPKPRREPIPLVYEHDVRYAKSFESVVSVALTYDNGGDIIMLSLTHEAARKLADRLLDATRCPACRGLGEVAATPGQPGDGTQPCRVCTPTQGLGVA